MTGALAIRRHWVRSLLLLLALAAVFSRALVPAGYMAVADGDRLSITLCGSGLPVALDLDGDEEPAPVQGEGGCVFAVAAAAAPPAGIASLDLPRQPLDRAAPAFPAAVHIGLGLAAPPPPSHAPPVLV